MATMNASAILLFVGVVIPATTGNYLSTAFGSGAPASAAIKTYPTQLIAAQSVKSE